LCFKAVQFWLSSFFDKNRTFACQNNNNNKKDVRGPHNETFHQNADLNSSGKILGNAILSPIFLTAQSAVAASSNNMLSIIGNVNPTYVNKDHYLHR
jgi:hypothetical protein